MYWTELELENFWMMAARRVDGRLGWVVLGVLAVAAQAAGAQTTGGRGTGPQPGAQTAPAPAALPDAPSAVMYDKLPMVNGRPYRKPTARQDLLAYRQELIGPRAFLSAGIRSGIEQARGVPTGWGKDFAGYAQRYGSAYAEETIDSSVRFAIAGALHEDVRYLVCHECTAGQKVRNAFLAEVTARHGADGHRAFSVTPIVAGVSGPLVAYSAWYPAGYGTSDALRHATFGLGTRILFHVVREFLADRSDRP